MYRSYAVAGVHEAICFDIHDMGICYGEQACHVTDYTLANLVSSYAE